MKRIQLILIGVIISLTVNSQAPEAFKYQAVVRDNAGNLMAEQSVNFQIDILKGALDGSAIYSETHSATTSAGGMVSLEIGNGTTTDDFSSINWGEDSYFIKIWVNGNEMGTSQLLSVPYALHANSAESISGEITESDPVYNGSQAANITSSDVANLANLSGTNTGDQDLSGLALKGALEDTAAAIRDDIPDVSGFIAEETDPLFTGSVAAGITANDTANWNSALPPIGSGTGNMIVAISGSVSDAEAAQIIEDYGGSNTKYLWVYNTTQLTTLDWSGLTELVELKLTGNQLLSTVSIPDVVNAVNIQIFSNPTLLSINLNALEACNELNISKNENLGSVQLLNLEFANSFSFRFNSSINSLSLPNFENVNELYISSCISMTSLNLEGLLSVSGQLNIQWLGITSLSMPNLINIQYLFLHDCLELASLNLTSLESVPQLDMNRLSLSALSFPKLEESSYFSVVGCSITSIDIPLLTSFDMISLNWNELTAQSINDLLAYFVSITPAITGKTISLSYQMPLTPPSGQGITDKNTLISNGNNVETD